MRPITLLNWIKSSQLLLLLFCISSCSFSSKKKDTTANTKEAQVVAAITDSAFQEIDQAKNLIHSGDLILRTGRDFTSDVVRKMSKKDQTYSHCGIANWENDTLFVYHSLGGQWNREQTIRRDTFAFFCNPYESKGLGIYRYQLKPQEIEQIVQITKEFYHQKITFDMQFDLATDDQMYCTEFIYKILLKALPNNHFIPLSHINHIPYIAVDNLFLNPNCVEIKRVVFPQS